MDAHSLWAQLWDPVFGTQNLFTTENLTFWDESLSQSISNLTFGIKFIKYEFTLAYVKLSFSFMSYAQNARKWYLYVTS